MPIPLSDPRVRQIVDVVAAVQNSEWIKVLERGGKEVARIVACAALPPGGPLKQPACDLIGKVIDTNGQQFGEVYGALSSGDWWGLIKAVTPLFGPEAACAVIPDNPVKDVACGTLGKLLAEAYQFAADLIGAGVAAVNKLAQLAGLAGSPHMPQEKYEQLYWKTWCHYGTWLCLRNGCSGLGDLYGRIHPACVEYFDSHQMSEDNADKTCDGMQARFDKAVKAYAEAMKAAGGAFAENKRPFARTWAVEDYGKNTSGARRDFIVQNCVFQMRKDFPFPEPIPARCESIKLGLLGGLEGGGLYEKCLKAEKSRMPSPSAWQHTCTGAGVKFSSILEQEKVRLESRIPTFMAAGCLPPMGWTAAQGLKFTCRTYEGYASCLRSLSPGLEQQHCTLDQSKADQRWAQTIAGALGPKRCKAVGLDVSCTRPWKRDACGTMLKEWSAALGVKSAVQCRFDNVTVYQMLIAKAAIIVKTLNGAPGSSPSNCKSTWDPLTIICSDPRVLSRLPELLPSMKFGQCPPDPNKDGADVPCYGGPVQNTAAAGPIFVQQEPKIASGIDLTALPAPHIVRRGATDPFQWGAAVTIGSEQALSTQDGMCYVGLHFEIQNVGSSASPPFEFTLGAKGSPPAMRRGP